MTSPTEEDRRALDELFSLTYDELRRLAGSILRTDPTAGKTPTTLVNEAWLKLVASPAALGTMALNASVAASFSATALTAGTHSITAQFAGTSGFTCCCQVEVVLAHIW